MKKLLIIFSILALMVSCNQATINQSIPIAETIEQVDIIAYTDTIIQRQNVRIFGQDSIHVFGRRGETQRVIYLNPKPIGGIRYRQFDNEGNVIEIAFTTNRPFTNDYFASDFWDRADMFPYMDSIVQFLPNSNIKIGFQAYRIDEIQFPRFTFLPNFNVYDSTGILVSRQIYNFWNRKTHTEIFDGWERVAFVHETFHPNGRLASRWFQGHACAAGAGIHSIEWDSLGRKTRENQLADSFPEWGTSGHDCFEVETITDFFSNGNVRRIRHLKSFSHSDACPCGEWLFFNEQGEIISRKMHPPCDYDYRFDCGDWQEEWVKD